MKRFVLALTAACLLLPTASAQAALIVPAVGGTVLTTASDDGTFGPRNIGFTFNFFGVNQTSVFVNTNGNLTFGAGSGVFANEPLPTGAPPRIAPFWDDLFLPPGEVREVTGAGFYAAIWNGVGFFGVGGNATFEVVLMGAGNPFGLAANTIVFGYGAIGNTDPTFAAGATVGLNQGNNAGFATLSSLGIGPANGVLNTAQAIGLSDDTYCFTPVGATYVATACSPTAIPEPATLTMVGLGALSLALRRRSR
jgi:PEP-CTERM motif